MTTTSSQQTEKPQASKRIGLITPYQGFNLGDGAIQETVIQTLTKLDSSVECHGITLYPADTQQRHGISSTRITGLVVERYSDPDLLFAVEAKPQRSLEENEKAEKEIDTPQAEFTTGQKIVELLRGVKNLPLLGSVLRFLVFRLRELKVISVEIREFLKSLKFARKLDLLLLSGGGQLDEAYGGAWGHPYSIFRWALIGKLTGTPFAIASCGSAEIESTLTCWFLRKSLKYADYRSYRDIGTRKQLAQRWEFTENDPIVRDLALGLDPAPFLSNTAEKSSELIIGVSPIYHSSPQYTTYDEFVEAMAEFIEWLANRGDRVLLYRTTSVERIVLRDIWNRLKLKDSKYISNRVTEVEADNFQELMKEIAVVDLVVASRLHSIILSHVLNKPTLAICWDRKVEAHMHDLEQEKYMIDIDELNGTVLKDLFQQMETNADQYRKMLNEKIDGFQNDIEKQYKYLIDLAGSNARQK